MKELTVSEASRQPVNFLYIFAEESFLKQLRSDHAKVIRQKRLNQMYLLDLSAKKYSTTYDEYRTAIKNAFTAAFNMTPAQALIKLAKGETVCGKNWKEGVYGIGSLNKSFKDTDISVDSKTGYMMRDGKYLPVYDTVYSNEGTSKEKAYQQFYYDESTGRTYMSQYNKTLKRWYAQSYSDKDGIEYSANNKQKLSAEDSATVWQGVVFSIQNFLEWLLSLFSTGKTTITEKNTLPDQKADGFVYQSGFGEAGTIVLALVAGGLLLGGGLKTGKKKGK